MRQPPRALTRKQLLTHAAAATLGLAAGGLARAQAPAPVAATLRIVIPANPGGGWDQTGRAIGQALLATGAAQQVEYTNIGGKGGVIGLERYVKDFDADPNALLVTGMVMVGALALHQPAVGLKHVQPLARLTSEYLTVAVQADSPIQKTKDLVAALRAQAASLPVAGGSAGGIDHLFAGMLVRAARVPPEQLNYQPYASGREVAKAVLEKRAAIAIAGYSEMADALASGKLRALGISSRVPLFGLPSFREQGLDLDMANWRGLLTGQRVPPERVQALAAALKRATAHESWQRTLQQNRWSAYWSEGASFADFLSVESGMVQAMGMLLKLKT